MNSRLDPASHVSSLPLAGSTGDVAELARIFQPDCHLMCLRRQVPPDLAGFLHAAFASGALRSGRRAVIDAGAALPPDMLPDLPGRDAVHEDVSRLSGLLADLTGCPRAGVRIEVLDRAMCPRWHVDQVGLRLLTTWIGPATEWLAEHCADRRLLGSDAVMVDASGIGRAGTGDVVLMKGEHWPDNAGRGVIHRSPALSTPHRVRIVAAFDAVW
jgi:hypothetical protein